MSLWRKIFFSNFNCNFIFIYISLFINYFYRVKMLKIHFWAPLVVINYSILFVYILSFNYKILFNGKFLFYFCTFSLLHHKINEKQLCQCSTDRCWTRIRSTASVTIFWFWFKRIFPDETIQNRTNRTQSRRKFY